MNFLLSVVAFTSLFCVSFAGNVWIENTFLDSGKTCSTGERVYNDEATLDECKAEAIELEGSYIYWQSNADRNNNGALCHIYTSCDTTRTPGDGGTNYEYGFLCMDEYGNWSNWSNVWIENTSLDSGKSCSTDERVKQFEATLDECKAEAIELDGSYIYWQSSADRNGANAYCHIHTSCDVTRDTEMGGTNYQYGFWSEACL